MDDKNKVVSDKCDDYILDIVKSSSYQNQTDEYCTKFRRWRTRKNNKYGYDYVRDTRERTYVDGQGYVHYSPHNAESIALSNCFKLFGLIFIVKHIINVIQSLVVQRMSGSLFLSPDYYSNNFTIDTAPLELVCVISAFSILQLIIPIIMFFAISKMPFRVAVPNSRENNIEVSLSGISIMLMMLVLGRVGNLMLGNIFAHVNIAVPNFNMLQSESVLGNIIYSLSECLIVPILMEVLYRGVVLQTFRQHGDFFALTMSCVFNCIAYSDLAKSGYVLLMAVVVGLFTLRSGSICTAIFMRISSRITTLVISIGLKYVDNEYVKTLELIIFFIIIAFSLITYGRMIKNKNCDFNIEDSKTHLTIKQRIIIFLSSREITILVVISLITMIFNIRLIE
ncbi:MAG: hypothetical protein GX896_09630 [Clostridiales bacterium]|nr:hypothetical protein [Clostridiales bacterium]